MSADIAAATALLVGLAACLARASRGSVLVRLVGLQLGGTVTALSLLLLAEGFGRSSYLILALVLALLSFAGLLVFVRFLQVEAEER